MIKSLNISRKPIFIAPKKSITVHKPTTPPEQVKTECEEQSSVKKLIEHCPNDKMAVESSDDEPLVIVEPTDPDEDRFKAEQESSLPEQEAGFPLNLKNNGSSAVTGDPILLNHILHTLSAKPIKRSHSLIYECLSSNNLFQSPTMAKFPQTRLPMSSYNAYKLQTPYSRLAAPKDTVSNTPQSVNGTPDSHPQASLSTTSQSSQAPACLLPAPDDNLTAPSLTSMESVQELFSTNPLLAAVLVNCTTASLITQLANSVSSTILSLAQQVVMEKTHNVSLNVTGLTQMLSTLTTLASTLSTSLSSLSNLQSQHAFSPNNILTSRAEQTPSTEQLLTSTLVPLAGTKQLPGQGDSKAESALEEHAVDELPSAPSFGPASNCRSTGNRLGHTRVRRLMCKQLGCGQGFYSKFGLIEHLRTHSEERPLTCSIAGVRSRLKRRPDVPEKSPVRKSGRTANGGQLFALLTKEVKEDSGIADTSTCTDATEESERCLEKELPSEEKRAKDDCDVNENSNSLRLNSIQGDFDADSSLVDEDMEGSKKVKRHFCPYPLCSRSYARRHRLNQHMCQHTGIGPYYCEEPNCNVRYFCPNDLERHKLIHLVPPSGDPTKRHMCPFPGCGKAYSKLNKLREHVRSHTGERPYVCDQPDCTASFIRLYGLKRHQLTHGASALRSPQGRPEAKYLRRMSSAPSTSLSLPSLLALAQSQLATKQEPKMVSLITDSSPLQPRQESTHRPTDCPLPALVISPLRASFPAQPRHSRASATPSASALALKAVVINGPFGKRRHICPMSGCKKIFPKLNKLREHICRHTGERPYACTECTSNFVRMYDLRRHALIHSRKQATPSSVTD